MNNVYTYNLVIHEIQCVLFVLLDYVNITKTETTIVLAALIGGRFEFPTKTKLVSTVCSISVSEPLAQSHRLEIQHCVKLETQREINYLHFVKAPSSATTLPFQFTLIEGGQFNPGSRYGVIDITFESDCLVAIVADQKLQPQSIEENHTMNQGTMN